MSNLSETNNVNLLDPDTEIDYSKMNRAARNHLQAKRKYQRDLIQVRECLSQIAAPSTSELSTLRFDALDQTRGSARLCIDWDACPDVCDLGGGNSLEKFGWTTTGEASATRLVSLSDAPNRKQKKRSAQHLASSAVLANTASMSSSEPATKAASNGANRPSQLPPSLAATNLPTISNASSDECHCQHAHASSPSTFSSSSSSSCASAGAESAVHPRVLRKRLQVESFAIILQAIAESLLSVSTSSSSASSTSSPPFPTQRLTVVDFGAGSGSLTLPLAWLFPQFDFVAVDLRRVSLQLLAERAKHAGLNNVKTCQCMIERYDGPLDVAVALHACGNATDHVLLHAQRRARAFVVSPCCIGKLKFSVKGGNSLGVVRRAEHYADAVWDPGQQSNQQELSSSTSFSSSSSASATSSDPSSSHFAESPEIQHPRSRWLSGFVSTDLFLTMARVADGVDASRLGEADDDACMRNTQAETDQLDSLARPLQQDEGPTATESIPSQPPTSAQSFEFQTSAAATALSSTLSAGSPSSSVPRSAVVSTVGLSRACKMRIEQDRCQAAREQGFDAYTLLLRQPHQQVPNKQDLLVGVRRSETDMVRALQDALTNCKVE